MAEWARNKAALLKKPKGRTSSSREQTEGADGESGPPSWKRTRNTGIWGDWTRNWTAWTGRKEPFSIAGLSGFAA